MNLPQDILDEIKRLGENPRTIDFIAESEGADFARFFLAGVAESARLFEKWFPRLKEFAESKRLANPLPPAESLTDIDLATRRILEPKIIDSERVPQRNAFTATLFSAPLVAHSLLKSNWPGQYEHSVILTPDELKEWHSIYHEPADAKWWFTFQDWDVQPNPSAESFWMENCEYSIPADSIGLLVIWGLQWGSLAGGHNAELWYLPAGGTERLLGLLGCATY